MASALLLSARFPSSQTIPFEASKDREANGIALGMSLRSSFYRKVVKFQGLERERFSSTRKELVLVASVLGRRSKVQKRECYSHSRLPDTDCPTWRFIWQLSLHEQSVAAPVGLLGLFLLFQTTRVRFVFDEEALEVKVGDELQESGQNVFVGGKNRWK